MVNRFITERNSKYIYVYIYVYIYIYIHIFIATYKSNIIILYCIPYIPIEIKLTKTRVGVVIIVAEDGTSGSAPRPALWVALALRRRGRQG